MNCITSETSKLIIKKYKENHQSKDFNLPTFIDISKEIDKDISYHDSCKIALRFSGTNGLNIPFSPEALKWVCNALISELKPSSILVPLADGSEHEYLGSGASIDYCFFNKQLESLAIKYCSIEPISRLEAGKEYEFIVSDLPFGSLKTNNTTHSIVEDSVSRLSENGFAVFTFHRRYTIGREKEWLINLSNIGLYCNAVLDMPINSYYPLTHADAIIAIFSKKRSEHLFAALLSDESSAQRVVTNFLNQCTIGNPKLGVYVNDELFSYSEFVTRSRIEKLYTSISKNYNSQLLRIIDLGTIDRATNPLENTATIYISNNSNYPVVTDSHDVQDTKQIYYTVTFDEDRIIPRFAAYFLNSDEGARLRQLCGDGLIIKTLSKNSIENLKIPCPSKEIQLQILTTNDQLERLRTEIDTLENRLKKHPLSFERIRTDMKDINNQTDKFEQWMESLPYPLATILKRYSVADESYKKYDMLLFFFEAYSIFESTILSAAINKDLLDCSSLRNVDPLRFEKSSYGSWVTMDRALSNLFLDTYNQKDDFSKTAVLSCFKTGDEKLIKYICSNKACNALDKACTLRNDWKGHSGIISEEKYQELLDTLISYLIDLRNSIKDLYERLRLIRPLDSTFTNGQFNYKVEILTGSNPALRKSRVASSIPLDTEKLYVQIIDTNEYLELPPFFILRNSPSDVKNACYFYNRVEGGNTRYVSYHFENRAEDTEVGEYAFENIKHMLASETLAD